MMRLAIASLRSRAQRSSHTSSRSSSAPCVIGAFATLLESPAATSPARTARRSSRWASSSAAGGWSSCCSPSRPPSRLTVRQRNSELARLRTVGATPRQNRRMLLVEAMSVTAVASLLAAVPAWLVGWGVFALLQHATCWPATPTAAPGSPRSVRPLPRWCSCPVSPFCSPPGGPRSRRCGRRRRESATGPTRLGKWRIGAGVLFLAAGLNYSLLTVTVMADSADPLAPMSTAGPACVFWSMGLALFAPVLLRMAAPLAAGSWFRLFGAAGHLAAHDTRARSHLLAAVLVPVIIFVGMGTGTIYLMAIESQARRRG